MDKEKPVWLLDVDGVLNVARPGWGAPPRNGIAHFGGVEFHMRWAPALVAEIIRLHRSDQVEVRWATTWANHITQVEGLLRLPSFPVAFNTPEDDPAVKAPALKLETALDILEREARPLIWTDDDAIPHAPALLNRLAAPGIPVLLVRTDPRVGLQPEDLAAIEQFLADPDAF